MLCSLSTLCMLREPHCQAIVAHQAGREVDAQGVPVGMHGGESCHVSTQTCAGVPQPLLAHLHPAQTVGRYHLGEFVNRFQHGSLVMRLPDSGEFAGSV